jgi:hypothetical protein
MRDVCNSLPVTFGELMPLRARRVGLAILRSGVVA